MVVVVRVRVVVRGASVFDFMPSRSVRATRTLARCSYNIKEDYQAAFSAVHTLALARSRKPARAAYSV